MVNKSTNSFENGLIKVDNKTKQPKNSYSFALNTVINDPINDPSSRTNEKGFDVYSRLKELPYNILGHIWLGGEQYVFFIKHKESAITRFNEIYYVDINKDEKRLLYSNLLLNFKDSKLIKGTYRVNYKNDRIIYWVDGENEDRVLNIDEDSTGLSIKVISLVAAYTRPTLNLTVNDSLGSLSTGQYFVGISYNIDEDFDTSVLSISRSVSIGLGKYNTTVNNDFGSVSGGIDIPVGKSIKVVVSNIPDEIEKYSLYLIKITDTGNKIKVITNISKTTTNEYTLTGNEGELDESITLADITVENPNYYASEVITQKENRLIRGNSKIKTTKLDYQSLANDIVVTYTVEEEKVYDKTTQLMQDDNRNVQDGRLTIPMITNEVDISPEYLAKTGDITISSTTFMRDEIYSLGLGFELTDGTETDVYHIPGRINDNLGAGITGTGDFGYVYNGSSLLWDTYVYGTDFNGYKTGDVTWKVRNTAVKTSSNGGVLGYWRSSLTYPDGYDYPTNGEKDSNNKSYIRHHKMPSDILEPLFRTEIYKGSTLITSANDQAEFNQKNVDYIYKIYKRKISLNLSNIAIPDELKGQIKKVKIFYTPRTEENKSIVSKGVIYGNSVGQTDMVRDANGNTFMGRGGGDINLEFLSPEANFGFKETSLSGNRLKAYSVIKGYKKYYGGYVSLSGSVPYQGVIFNNELFNATQRLQGVCMGNLFYNQTTPVRENFQNRNIDKVVYVDRAFKGSTEGISIPQYEIEPCALIQLNGIEGLGFKNDFSDNMRTVYPNLFYLDYADEQFPCIGLSLLINGGPSYVPFRAPYDTAYYGAIIKDNATLYGDVRNLSYMDSGAYIALDGTESLVACDVKVGDTFIDVHHFKKASTLLKTGSTMKAYDATVTSGSSIKDINELKSMNFCSAIVETDMNIRMRNEGSGTDDKYFPKSYLADTSLNDIQKAANRAEYYNIQDSYNTKYIKLYFGNDVKIIDLDDQDDKYSTRLIYSEKQNLESRNDNYRIVKANNYRDLNANRGPITGLFIKQENLFALTRDSLFSVYTSNQTIKTEDESNITVGTGEFFGIEPKELVSIEGGFGGTSSKWSIIESPYGYLFIDRLKGKCLLFSDQIKDLNILGLNEDFTLTISKEFPTLFKDFDNPVNDLGLISIYDPKLLRLIVTKKDYSLLDPTKNKGEWDANTVYARGDVFAKDGSLKTIKDVSYLESEDFSDWSTSIFQQEFNNKFQ